MAQHKKRVFSANFAEDSDSEEAPYSEYSKIRLIHIDPTDKLRNEVTSLRAQLVHFSGQQDSVAHALEANGGLLLKLSVVKARLETKDVLIHEYQKKIDITRGLGSKETDAAAVVYNLTQALVSIDTERIKKSQNSFDSEEDNSFLNHWSIMLSQEVQTLDHRYNVLWNDYERLRVELIHARQLRLHTTNSTEPDQHLDGENCDGGSRIYQNYAVKLRGLSRERPEPSADVSSWIMWLEALKDTNVEALVELNAGRCSLLPKPGCIGAINSMLQMLLEDNQEQKSTELICEEVRASKVPKGTLEMMLIEKSKQPPLEWERSSETIRQDEAYQAKHVLEKEMTVVKQEVLNLQWENKELQSMLTEATNSKELQDTRLELIAQQEHQVDLFEARILAADHHRDLLEVSLKQAWECKSLELKRKCEEFDTIEEEVKAIKTVLDDKDTQLKRSDQRLLESDSALQSYRGLEQEHAIRSGTLEEELTAAKQETCRLKAENGDVRLTLKDMQTSASRVLQEKLQEQRKERQYFDEALKEMNRCKDLLEYSLKEAWECKNQEFRDSQRELSNLQEDIKSVRQILEEKETQIQGNQREISRLEASLRQKDEESDHIDSVEIDHQMQIDSLQEDIKYFEATAHQLEAYRDSLEADLQSEEGRVRDLEATLLKKETEHALTCKSLEDRLIASRRHNEARVAKTLLTELQRAHDLQSEQFKAVQEKLILANEVNAQVKDLVAEKEQNLAASQGQAKEMQRQIMHLEYELTQSQRQIRNKDLHPTVSILQDENLAKALRIKELQDILEYHKIDHRSTTDNPSTMRTDQFQTPAVSSRDIQMQDRLHTRISTPSSSHGQSEDFTASATHEPSSVSSRNSLVSSHLPVVEMQSSRPSVAFIGKSSVSSVQGSQNLRFGGLSKSLRNAPVAAELQMTTRRQYTLQSSEIRPLSQQFILKSRHRKRSPQRKPSIYSKRPRADTEPESGNFDEGKVQED
ncbi:hypothetical protein GG344DRAFT_82284 [Lentinula edodes]|nr:hypothetical protein GG344DRAFT_82284 [Lentinula edodes]